jgi:NADPH:quinone reductase-like Zn-dependent oxidoreductase
MKAVVLTEYGDVDRFEVRDLPDPVPGPNQIAVRTAATSINPIDWKLRSGAAQKFMPLQLPAVLGRDSSGAVAALGPGVTGFVPGARVAGLVHGAYAEIVVASVEAWAEIPASLNLIDAAALPLVGLTGAQLIEDAVGAREGEAVLVTGATGSVGRAAVFAARARGARVYAGVRAKHRAEAAKLGAHAVVALDDAAEIAQLPLLDAVADTVGGATTQKLLAHVKPGGRIGSVVGEPAGAKERGLIVRAFLAHPDSKRLGELARAMADGKLVIPIARRFPLAETAQAQKLAESGGANGKVVVTI